MQYKNVTFIGTSHISQDSVNSVKKFIQEENPGIVAIELDHERAMGLLQGGDRKPGLKDIRSIGLKGYIFMLIASYAQKKLGEYVKLKPGSEMKVAMQEARKHNARISFIDQNIRITLKKLSKRITWKEKGRFVADIIRGFFKKPEIEFDIRTVPDDKVINKLIKQLGNRYPNVYDVLIAERNEVLASNLHHLMNNNMSEKILAVMGAGHVEEVIKLLKEKNNKIDYVFSV